MSPFIVKVIVDYYYFVTFYLIFLWGWINMKISIVTISFNQAKYLRQCIDSVLSQDYSNIEYIVVDPGSTDGSREIIESYGDRVIKVFEKDAGPADGLNKGFERATGQIYCYLNSDDTLCSGALTAVANKYKEFHSADIIYGHGYVIDEHNLHLRKCYSDIFSLMAAAYGAAVVIQPSTFFRAEAFKAVGGFNKENRSNWDGELFIDFAMHDLKLQRINNFLSNYRIHEEGITGSGRLEILHREYRDRMFEKIMGRKKHKFDDLFALAYRIKKHFFNPSATIERLRFGPIFGSRV